MKVIATVKGNSKKKMTSKVITINVLFFVYHAIVSDYYAGRITQITENSKEFLLANIANVSKILSKHNHETQHTN